MRNVKTPTSTRQSVVLPIVFIAAFTAILLSFVPSVVLAARDNNTFVLSFAIPAMIVVVVLDGVAIALLRKGQRRNSKP
jgi:hypothetical protein